MNVYDFDKTIYKGDSSVDFFLFCLLRHPLLFFYIPYQTLAIIAYKLKLCSKETEKSAFFSFLKSISDIDNDIQLFWTKKIKKISAWYIRQKKDDDVVISASPDFLLLYVCRKLGISRLIATKVNKKTGKLQSKNCYGEEKVKRFDAYFPTANIDLFYSDSKSDLPLAIKARKAYMVHKHNTIKEWLHYER